MSETMSEEETTPLRLFQGYGVELEYMLVRIQDLTVVPAVDSVLRKIAGATVNDVEIDSISWSNELVLHVMELKNTLPAPALVPLSEIFATHVQRMNAKIEPEGWMLLPGSMHPFMNPREETRLWPHEGKEIYETFDRVFDCRRHGWANLQSAQINYSFGSDEEFGRLHAAIRLALPILPALAASSPVAEGEVTGLADTRLEVYRTNGAKLQTVVGSLIPEPLFTRKDYEARIFEPMYRELEPHDPEGVLRHPWLNARGAIAQFVRDAIEIRVLDIQECPAADIAIGCATSALVKALVEESLCDYERQRSWAVPPLVEIFRATLRDAEEAVVRDAGYLRDLGFPDRDATARDLWLYLLERLDGTYDGLDSPYLKVITKEGPLSRRILRALPRNPRKEDIVVVYRALARCLDLGESFLAP
jgi:glutamate---cysteine ligase / carboxylate-amine ligase